MRIGMTTRRGLLLAAAALAVSVGIAGFLAPIAQSEPRGDSPPDTGKQGSPRDRSPSHGSDSGQDIYYYYDHYRGQHRWGYLVVDYWRHYEDDGSHYYLFKCRLYLPQRSGFGGGSSSNWDVDYGSGSAYAHRGAGHDPSHNRHHEGLLAFTLYDNEGRSYKYYECVPHHYGTWHFVPQTSSDHRRHPSPEWFWLERYEGNWHPS